VGANLNFSRECFRNIFKIDLTKDDQGAKVANHWKNQLVH
jgi:hypothetical protein